MSTLNGRLWAVLSERGREAAGLTYLEAAALVRELRDGVGAGDGKVRGLCIVTARAGERVAPAKKDSAAKAEPAPPSHADAVDKPKRARRATRKKDA